MTSIVAAGSAGALGLALLAMGSGVGAEFTASGTATARIATGTFNCQLSAAADSGVTISQDGHTATVDLGTINSSAASSKTAPVTVTNTGTIPLATTWSETTTGNILGGSGAISPIAAAAGVQLGAATAETVNIGFTWSQLENSDLNRSGTAQYTVSCNEPSSSSPSLRLFSNTGGTANYDAINGNILLGLPISTAVAAGVQVVNPGTALPATAPTFTTDNYAAGSPRWLIYFSDGNHAFGYPSNAPAGTRNMWGVNNDTPGSYAALLTAESAATVTEVDIVMDADQTPPSTSTISCINYNGSLLGAGTCS